MRGYTVALKPALGALRLPCDCRHEVGARMTLGLSGYDKGRKASIVDGFCCLDCGSDPTGTLEPWDAMDRCWQQFGWHRQIGERLLDLADWWRLHTPADQVMPVWMIVAMGRELPVPLDDAEAPS